jgi:hypothetical protein
VLRYQRVDGALHSFQFQFTQYVGVRGGVCFFVGFGVLGLFFAMVAGFVLMGGYVESSSG